MDDETNKRSSPSPCEKSRTYRRRTRHGRPRTRARIDGTTSREHRGPSSSHDINEHTLVIPFPVPPSLSTDWLLRTAPVILARHLLYARGMWPMSVPQLMLLYNEEQQVSNNTCRNDEDDSIGTTTKNKRRRMNKSKRVSPSLRRKQRRAMDQIKRLCDEWYKALALINDGDNCNAHPSYVQTSPVSSLRSSSPSPHQSFRQRQRQRQRKNENKQDQIQSPMYLLISLGSSYRQSRELYLLDFQSLFDDDQAFNCSGVKTAMHTSERQQKMETMLTRKLISALMNQTGDGDQPSPMNSLPSTTSASFRLWFTAGFEVSHSDDDFDKSATLERITHTDSIPNPPDGDNPPDADAKDSTISTWAWVPRAKFPQIERQSKSRPSSWKQSLVTIRFNRSLPKQQQEYNKFRITRPQIHPTSNGLTWMSLPACIKGFRL